MADFGKIYITFFFNLFWMTDQYGFLGPRAHPGGWIVGFLSVIFMGYYLSRLNPSMPNDRKRRSQKSISHSRWLANVSMVQRYFAKTFIVTCLLFIWGLLRDFHIILSSGPWKRICF